MKDFDIVTAVMFGFGVLLLLWIASAFN